MDFTREPIIETVITPKEGCKLVVRSSKSTGQEEYFVDAVEVASFGSALFFRSLERPKAFLVPASDYEILEVREARMVLKNVGIDRAIKIAGGREAQMRGGRETPPVEKPEPLPEEPAISAVTEEVQDASAAAPDAKSDTRIDKKRDRRRHYRRRRGREEAGTRDAATPLELGEDKSESVYKEGDASKADSVEPKKTEGTTEMPSMPVTPTASFLTSLLPPPTNLISETIARYKDNALFKQAFYLKEQDGKEGEEMSSETPSIPLQQPEYGSYEMSEEEEEDIYQHRRKREDHPEEEKEEEKEPLQESLEQPPLESKDELPN